MRRKARKSTGGSALPNASNQAIVNGPAPSPHPNSRRQSQQGGGHPFANVHNSERDGTYDASNVAVPSQAGMQPIAPMTVNGRGGNTAANSQQLGEGDYGVNGNGKGGNGFLRLISCGMCR